MKQIVNPYLPSYEYVPDAEPHVFNGRVYIYGSHDLFDGGGFCLGDYITYSAPIDDLKSWRFEGFIFRKDQDPMNKKKLKALYAPDCIQGPDGKYYLYYSVTESGVIGVAVSNSPAGPFDFHGYVKYQDGQILGRRKGDVFQFDPGIYVEGNDVYLYSAFCPDLMGIFVTGGKKVSKVGPLCMKLDVDMLTILEGPHEIGVKSIACSKNTPYEGHEFFEASSMRKINGRYYFVYSSYKGHELCYAISDRPDGDFKFGGTIVSIGDVGLRGIKGVKDAANMTGNTHGSILTIGDKHYIFYHRQTNRNCFSRQACAEEIKILEDGSIPQVEVTSCGLNGGPLVGLGEYEARIACNLECKKGGTFYQVFKGTGRPYFTQTGKDRECDGDQYITNILDGTKMTYKYFDFDEAKELSVNLSSTGKGVMEVLDENNNVVAKFDVSKGEKMDLVSSLTIEKGVHSLCFSYKGKGKVSFFKFVLR
ncbi:MAG: family 43 glycosylhydrolase [Bacillales bacterium]|nr:family 43 glycosylhydrolase [Bacillales bacterium]